MHPQHDRFAAHSGNTQMSLCKEEWETFLHALEEIQQEGRHDIHTALFSVLYTVLIDFFLVAPTLHRTPDTSGFVRLATVVCLAIFVTVQVQRIARLRGSLTFNKTLYEDYTQELSAQYGLHYHQGKLRPQSTKESP